MTASGGGSAASRVSGLSRRRLLAALGGVGAVGTASGAGTFAYLSDRETLASNDIGTGTLDLLIDDTVVDGPVEINVNGIDRGRSGHHTLMLGVRTNAARIWLATDCPERGDDLSEALEVRLTVDDRSVSGDWRSFAAFRRVFVNGLRLDDGCLPPDEGVPVTLHWRLPKDVDDELEGSATRFAFQLYAEQCRHVSEDDAVGSNPFAEIGPCDEPPDCAVCEEGHGTKLQTLALRYLGSETADIIVTGQGGSWASSGTVVFDGSVGGGETFTIDATVFGEDRLPRTLYLDDSGGSDDIAPDENIGSGGSGNSGTTGGEPPDHAGGGPPDHAGGSNEPDVVNIHTSCSVSLRVGDSFPEDDDSLYEIVSATTAAGELLCGSEDN